MTLKSDAETLPGVVKLKARRSAFIRYLAMAALVSFGAGLGTGFLSGLFESGQLPIWTLYACWAVVLAGMAWFTRDYFRRIDELDLADNLWSHLIGYYLTLWAFGLWYLLYDLGRAPEPTALPVMLFMIVATFVVYGARKLGLR